MLYSPFEIPSIYHSVFCTPVLNVPCATWRLYNPMSIRTGESSFSLHSCTMPSYNFQLTLGQSMETWSIFFFSKSLISSSHFFFRSSTWVWPRNPEVRYLQVTLSLLKYITIKSICSSCSSVLCDSSNEMTKHWASFSSLRSCCLKYGAMPKQIRCENFVGPQFIFVQWHILGTQPSRLLLYQLLSCMRNETWQYSKPTEFLLYANDLSM